MIVQDFVQGTISRQELCRECTGSDVIELIQPVALVTPGSCDLIDVHENFAEKLKLSLLHLMLEDMTRVRQIKILQF